MNYLSCRRCFNTAASVSRFLNEHIKLVTQPIVPTGGSSLMESIWTFAAMARHTVVAKLRAYFFGRRRGSNHSVMKEA
jgi:hypothetical protein